MKIVQHKFVEFMPDNIEEGVLYISVHYCTAIHKCVCGCGNEVVTPLSPTDWELTFDGRTVSLYPSIGNWNFDCRSHYFIRNNKVEHARKWSDKEIRRGKSNDTENKKKDSYGKEDKLRRKKNRNNKFLNRLKNKND